MCNTVFKMQCLKNVSKFSGSEGSVGLINHIPTDDFWSHSCL